MGYFVKRDNGTWGPISRFFVKGDDGHWHTIVKAFVKGSSSWSQFWPTSSTTGPQINAVPTISAGSWTVSSSIGRFTLTGINNTWTYSGGGTISQTYQFQFSIDGTNWINLGSSGSITNGQTKTLIVYQSDYVTDTQYYRFSVTAVANVNNTTNTESSTGTSVTIPYPTALTGGYVQAVSSGTGNLYPSVGTVDATGGFGDFTLSWSSLTNVSSLVVSWTPSDTSPTSPQTYYTAGSITPTKNVSTLTSVTASLTAYGTAGSGGSFSAGWDTSAYANQYKIDYSINYNNYYN